ncbi:Transmembrane protein 11 [Fasciola gigantica]|uniref:Transmembrane protein 11 n=1 Tax=Fasciola gigantica TaxID=46835 RepID=A0A504Z8P3_FASGI|nr:Transmembrane protein 11 [Fasciola gigantica]
MHTNGHTPNGVSSCNAGNSSSPTWPNPRSSPNGSSTASIGLRSRPVIVENWAGSGGPPLRPVVLVHRDDGRRKFLHNSIALASTLVTGYVLYQWSRSSSS